MANQQSQTTQKHPRSTRMWGVVTPRGKVLAVSAFRSEITQDCHFEIAHEGAQVKRVVVMVEAADAR